MNRNIGIIGIAFATVFTGSVLGETLALRCNVRSHGEDYLEKYMIDLSSGQVLDGCAVKKGRGECKVVIYPDKYIIKWSTNNGSGEGYSEIDRSTGTIQAYSRFSRRDEIEPAGKGRCEKIEQTSTKF